MIQNTNVGQLSQQQQQQVNAGVGYGVLPNLQLPVDLDINNISDRVMDSGSTSRKIFGMINPDMFWKIPAFAGVLYALQWKFASKFAGQYAQSWLGKCASFGDNIANSKLGKPVIDGVFRGWDFVAQKAAQLVKKFPVLQGVATGTKPVGKMALNQTNPGLFFAVDDAVDVIEGIRKQNPGALAKYTPELLAKMRIEPKKYVNELIKDLSLLPDKELKIGVIPRKIYISQSINSLKAVTGQSESKTRLGNSLPFWTTLGVESMTGAMLGGSASILGQSLGLAMSTQAAIDAPKGEKTAKGMEEFIQFFTFFAAMPIVMKLLHGLGGLQYTGMSKKQIEAFRARLEDVNSKPIADAKAHKLLKTELNQVFKDTSKWYYKPFRMIGSMCSVGLERIKPHNKAKFGKFAYKFKGVLGYVTRLPLFALVFSPLVNDPFIKLSHLIFGRPTDSLLGNLQEEKMAKFMKNPTIKLDDVFDAANARNPIEVQKAQQNAIPDELDPLNTPAPVHFNMQKNVTVPVVQQQQAPVPNPQQMPAPPQQPVQQPLAQETLGASVLNNSMVGRSYIPASTPVIPNVAPVNSSLSNKQEKALRKADFAEQEALALLGKGGHY